MSGWRGWLAAPVIAGLLTCSGGGPGDTGEAGGPDDPIAQQCTPMTCAEAGATCGTIPDGCDRTLECGSCPAGQTCGGGGTPNACGSGACKPKTCADLGASCGSVSDGCGKTLACGTCGPGETCGGGGKPNVCSADSTLGALRWLQISTTPVAAVSSNHTGSLAVLLGSYTAKMLARHDASGKASWSIPVPADALVATMAASGDVFLLGGYECYGCGPRIDRVSADGARITTVARGDDMTVYSRVAVNPRGDWAYTTAWNSQNSSITLYRADGREIVITWSEPFTMIFHTVALDEAGNVIAAGEALQELGFGGEKYPPGPTLMKFDPAGRPLWVRTLPASGAVSMLATTRIGTVVLLGYFNGTMPWGPSIFRGGDAVFVAEADGTPRFFRTLPPTGIGEYWHLAVDPAGKMTLGATMPGCQGAMVREINLAGENLWTKAYQSDECAVAVRGVADLPGGAIVGGVFTGVVDFGNGPKRSNEYGSGYLVDYGT